MNIGEIARRAGVSRSTVSYALSGRRTVSEETKRRIQAVIDELDYRPNAAARALKEGRTRTLGLVIPPASLRLTDMQLGFVASVVEAAARADLDVLLSPSGGDHDRSFERVVTGRRVDGVILMEIRLEDERVTRLRQTGLPFVTIGHTAQPQGTCWVDVDYAVLIARCVHHLADLGHRTIALINRSTELVAAGYGPAHRALSGFAEAVAERGLTGVELNCADDAAAGDSCFEQLRESHPEVTAIATINEAALPGVQRGIERAGLRVPRDLSLAGVAARHWAEDFRPQLTAADVPTLEMGALAVDLLLERIAAPQSPPRHLMLIRPVSPRATARLLPADFSNFSPQTSRMESELSRLSRRMIASLLTANLACGLLTAPPAFALTETGTAKQVLHYDFDGDISGGVVADRSGSGLDGILVNPGSATQIDGVDGTRALNLPGGESTSTTAPYVSLPNGLFKNLSAATIATRVKWAGGADFQWIYCIGKDLNTATFATPSYSGVSKTRSSIKPVNGSAEVGVDATAKLPADQWVDLVTTIDGRSISYYLNGVKVGSAAATVNLAAIMYSATNTTSGFLGKPFWGGHPFFAGAIDDFQVWDGAFSDDQVAALAGSRLATLTKVAQTSFAVTTPLGTAPVLPSVTGSYSDGIDRVLPVTWATIDPDRYARRGTFTVDGVVTGTGIAVSVSVTVVAPGDLTIDLGTNTGAFHGGASGTLYGVYGDGVPSRNLIEGMGLRTVSTKAQDGPQHPGADALDVVKPLADSTGGDVYIYMTDIYRGFPYEWPGATPQARLDDFKTKIAKQVDQVLTLAPKYREHVVFVPFNEPEGNMFGTGSWSYNGVSWLSDPRYFYAAWDEVYALIRSRMPAARIAGPNTSVLYDQDKDFLRHTLAAGTVPDVFTWHELSEPARIRTDVARYRAWEDELLAGRHLPININEYAFNYHTSVPGQMIQWVSAIEDSKVDADIAYWNIDGNLSDSAVQANRANGQWWLMHTYAQMSGHTVRVVPPFPGASYTMQAVATLDPAKAQARALFGGASGTGVVTFTGVDRRLFGRSVHALVQEIPWTGQIGDSAQPRVVADFDQDVVDGAVTVDFGSRLPRLDASSAYQVILTPGRQRADTTPATDLWSAGYEAEDAAHTGSGYSRNGPEGTPSDVSKFYTSGDYDVGGLRTGSDVVLDFGVSVPTTGVYDLSVFANSLNTYALVADQGPTNVFLRVDGAAEQELFLPLGYKWVVWDHADAKVSLTAGHHTISLAARSLDGTRATKGDAIVDRITLTLPNPAAAESVYEAEYARLDGARIDRGRVSLTARQSATFWVYSSDDGESTLGIDAGGNGRAALAVNGQQITQVRGRTRMKVFLSGGINKITVTGVSGRLGLDRLRIAKSAGTLTPTWYEAEDARLAGTAAVTSLALAGGGKAVTGVGGDPGNGNTLTFDVRVPRAGSYALTVRYANPEQSPATHYNPDPLARHADISVDGGPAQRVLFPHTFHADNFWYLSVPVRLAAGANTVRFQSAELPDFDGTTSISTRYPDLLLRSRYAPVIDKIAITPLAAL